MINVLKINCGLLPVDIETSVWVLVITKPWAVTELEQGLAVLHHKLF